jgi:hypothetical protein
MVQAIVLHTEGDQVARVQLQIWPTAEHDVMEWEDMILEEEVISDQ